jgi:hypothetical protein
VLACLLGWFVGSNLLGVLRTAVDIASCRDASKVLCGSAGWCPSVAPTDSSSSPKPLLQPDSDSRLRGGAHAIAWQQQGCSKSLAAAGQSCAAAASQGGHSHWLYTSRAGRVQQQGHRCFGLLGIGGGGRGCDIVSGYCDIRPAGWVCVGFVFLGTVLDRLEPSADRMYLSCHTAQRM